MFVDWRQPLYLCRHLTNHPFICQNLLVEEERSEVHLWLNTWSGIEPTNKKFAPWNTSVKTKPSFSLNPPTLHTLDLTRPFPSPSPLPAVNHTHGAGESGLEVTLRELWPFGQSTRTELLCVDSCMWISYKNYPQSLAPLCFFAISNGGCHGQSPELSTDLVQVALWLLSSPRSCPDPWSLTPRGAPRALSGGRGWNCCWGRGDMGISPGWEVWVYKWAFI